MEREAVIGALKRRWWIVVGLTVLGALLAGLPAPDRTVDASTSVVYTAGTVLFIESDSGNLYSDPIALQRIATQATGGEVIRRSAEELDTSESALAGQVVAELNQADGSLTLSTTQAESGRAVPLVDTVAQQLIAVTAENQDTVREQRLTASLSRLTDLETQIRDLQSDVAARPDDRILQSQLDALSRQYSVVFEQYDALQNDTNRLVLTVFSKGDEVRTENTVEGLRPPQSRLGRALLGGIAGLTLGIGLAVLLGRLDRRLRSRSQIETVFGMRAQCVIPLGAADRLLGVAVMPERHDPLSDAYRTLRSVVSFVQTDNEAADHARGHVTLVVSPGPSDGKTSVAANLAAAFVEAGNRVVAVNTDFRRPSLSARILGSRPAPIPLPVESVHTAGVNVLLQRTAISDLGLLDLAGIDAPPGELARETARLIPEAASLADQIVVDTSPIGLTAEVLELVPSADTIVLVVRIDHTSSTSSVRSLEILKAVATSPILLVIVGDTAERTNQYYYEYRSKRPKANWWKRSKPTA